MGSVRISIENFTAAEVARWLRTSLEMAWGMPDEQWNRLDKFCSRLEKKVDWREYCKEDMEVE